MLAEPLVESTARMQPALRSVAGSQKALQKWGLLEALEQDNGENAPVAKKSWKV